MSEGEGCVGGVRTGRLSPDGQTDPQQPGFTRTHSSFRPGPADGPRDAAKALPSAVSEACCGGAAPELLLAGARPGPPTRVETTRLPLLRLLVESLLERLLLLRPRGSRH